MSLASKLAFQFERQVRFKGIGLFNARLVRVTDSGPSHLYGSVLGGSEYEIRLRHDDSKLLVSCDCPSDVDRGECKHLWAGVLEADRLGALRNALGERYLKVEDDFGFDDEYSGYNYDHVPRRRGQVVPVRPQIPPWREYLTAIRHGLEQKNTPAANWPRDFEVLYSIDLAGSRNSGTLMVELLSHTRKKNGDWASIKEFRITAAQTASLPDPADAEIIAALFGGQEYFSLQYYYAASTPTRKALPPVLARKLMPLMSATGRLRLRPSTGSMDLQPVTWDEGEAWRLWLEVRQDDRDQWKITGSLRRGEERMELAEPLLILEGVFLIARGSVARFDAANTFPWVAQLRNLKNIPFPDRARDTVLAGLLDCAVVPPMEVDEALRFQERRVEPRLGLRVMQRNESWGPESFQAQLLLDYGQGWVNDVSEGRGIWIPAERVYIPRNAEVEQEARNTLKDLGLKP